MIYLRELINKKIEQFDQEIAGASTEKVALAIVRMKRRWLCRNDLYYLTCLCGNEEIAKYPEIYQPFCDEVSLMTYQVARLGIHKTNDDLLLYNLVADNEDFKLIERMYLCHRVFFKTTIVTKTHSLQLLINFPNIHIVLAHNKESNASANLVAIKNYFLTTDIGKIFQECVPRSKEWGTMTNFSLSNRRDWGRDEHSIMAVGVDTEITGGHWQIAKKNDLVTEKSVNTEDQIKKTQDWDARFNIGHFDNPEIRLQDYEGTRYHFADLYSVKKNDLNIKLIEKPLLIDRNPDNITERNILNPKRFSIDGIRDMKRDIWVFMCQHMLKPEDPARMQFKKEMICYFSSIPRECLFYMLVDPASARKKKSDYTVILIIGIDHKGRKYIIDGIRDRINPKKRIDLAIELAKKWSIKGCGWEAIAFQETDCFYLEETRRKEQLFFSITEIKSHKVSKEDRIRGLVPEYANHEWLWPEKGKVVKLSLFDGRNYDLTEEIEDEFLNFPMSEHDDLMDTQTFFNRISTIKPIEMKHEDRDGMTFGEYAKLREDREAEEALDPWGKFKIGVRV